MGVIPMETIIAAAITGAVTLIVCLITNNTQAEKTRALLDYKITELTKRVEKHNNVVERMYKLEGEVSECQHDICDLKKHHEPK